ncbi:MAG: aldo/keto reductase [Ferrovum sp.]|nr:aldo/keto reductase [Ferrovum sp.]NDU87640.1 aldo/keto reductase [Ferrovum sp.]
MDKKPLGTQGLKVSALGLGCMGMSEFYGQRNDASSIDTLHRALDLGVNFLDTADMYGPFTNETLVGKAIKGRRQDVVIATKFANVRNDKGEFLGVRGDPAYVKSCCEASLKRLGVDHIDLYYQHRVDLQVPIEDTVGAMADLVREGKVRYLGLSEAAAATVRRAHKVHPISALQTEYSLWSRDVEEDILPTTRDLGIGFVAYSPLGRGFLTGQIKRLEDLEENDYRRRSPRFMGENFQTNLHLVQAIQDLAQRKGCTSAQLAIAWVMAQGHDIVPIPGSKTLPHLEDNLKAMEVSLSPEELQHIDLLIPRGAAVGDRYAPQMMHTLNR